MEGMRIQGPGVKIWMLQSKLPGTSYRFLDRQSARMVILSEEQVKKRLGIEEAVSSLEEMFKRDYAKTADIPMRIQMQGLGGSTFLVMPCSDGGVPGAGLKFVTIRNGGRLDGDRVQAEYILFDSNGKVCAVMGAQYLTEVRTAAVSAIATRMLARQDSRTLGVFGTGRQARSHLLVLSHGRRFERFLVCGSERSRSEKFAEMMAERHGLRVEPVNATKCVRESDVICACTTSKTPLFDGTLIREGTHLNLVGSYQPETREVDDVVIGQSRIVVDSYEAALSEAGDLLIPLRSGVIAEDRIIGDLHEIVSGKTAGRINEGDITIFKSVGFALEDLVVATLAYQGLRNCAALAPSDPAE